MAISVQSACRKLSIRHLVQYSTAAKTAPVREEPLQFFRTNENDPKNHTEQHLYRYYSMPTEHRKLLFSLGGITVGLEKQMDTFAENCLMVRKPAVEILSYLKQADYSKPVNKYVLYGEWGTGKSCILAHLLHYGFMSNKLLVHVTWILEWFKSPKEFAPSTTRPNCMNLPINSAAWLMSFKNYNYNILNHPDFKVSKTYEWSPMEKTVAEAPIMDLINHGINRIKYASDVMIVLMDEIKIASNAGICETLVVIDGFNGLFTDYTRIKNDLKQFVPASQVTLTEALLKITESNWRNGAIILSVDQKATNRRRESIYPRYLLSKEGFEHIDPFIPILVENYNDEEYENTMEYFKNRKWVRDISSQGLQEIRALCKSNPRRVRDYCTSL